mmetsp:Transcript_23769/g.52671  ORF Transcript_23769/g.52671 Transcript_23769/m.52671 type:complete len:91 (+) Transcript_23769:86-358(+)
MSLLQEPLLLRAGANGSLHICRQMARETAVISAHVPQHPLSIVAMLPVVQHPQLRELQLSGLLPLDRLEATADTGATGTQCAAAIQDLGL